MAYWIKKAKGGFRFSKESLEPAINTVLFF